jgi:hypothetical protein
MRWFCKQSDNCRAILLLLAAVCKLPDITGVSYPVILLSKK